MLAIRVFVSSLDEEVVVSEGRGFGHRSGKQKGETRRASEWDTERGDKAIAGPSGARVGVHTFQVVWNIWKEGCIHFTSIKILGKSV